MQISTKLTQRFVWSLPGTYTLKFPDPVSYARCVIIGAGGGGVGFTGTGGPGGGGGGGAGGFIDGYFATVPGMTYQLCVGAGGASCSSGGNSFICSSNDYSIVTTAPTSSSISTQSFGLAYGGGSQSATYTETRTNIGTTSVSPGGIGGSTKIYQPSPVISIKGGDGAEGCNLNSTINARDNYDQGYYAGYNGSGGGGGIGLAKGSIGRMAAGGSGGGSFGSKAGDGYANNGQGTGAPGGIFYSGGGSLIIAGTTSGICAAGCGLYGGSIQGTSGFNIFCQQTSANTNATTNTGGGGGYGSTANGKVCYAGSGYLSPNPSPYLGVPIWIEYFNTIFNFMSGGSSGIRSAFGTANGIPYTNLCAGGVGDTDTVQAPGRDSSICGGGGGAIGSTAPVIGGQGACGGGGGGGYTGGTGGNGLIIVEW